MVESRDGEKGKPTSRFETGGIYWFDARPFGKVQMVGPVNFLFTSGPFPAPLPVRMSGPVCVLVKSFQDRLELTLFVQV